MPDNEKKSQTGEEISIQEITRQALLKPFSDDREWDEFQVKNELHYLVQINALAIIEIGKRLIFAKNNVPQGNWLNFLKSVNISTSTAAKYMRAGRELADRPRLKQLQSGIEKINIILNADPEDLDDFEKSGELFGADTDELTSMPREELKKLVRTKTKRLDEAKEQVQVLEEDLQKIKGEEIDLDTYFAEIENLRHQFVFKIQQYCKDAVESRIPYKILAAYFLCDLTRHQLAFKAVEMEKQTGLDNLLQCMVAPYSSLHFQTQSIPDLVHEGVKELTPIIEALDAPDEEIIDQSPEEAGK